MEGDRVNVLIVQSQPELGRIWQNHLQRQGMDVTVAECQDSATGHIAAEPYDIIVLDLLLKTGSGLSVADYANYRQPDARVVFVTNTSFFSDGSIFNHAANARAFLPTDTPPDDLAAVVEHYGKTI